MNGTLLAKSAVALFNISVLTALFRSGVEADAKGQVGSIIWSRVSPC